MGKLVYVMISVAAAGAALDWVRRGVADGFGWADALPYAISYSHTDLYRAVFFLLLALYFAALGWIPRTDPALAPLLMSFRSATTMRGLIVSAAVVLAYLGGRWVSANSQLPYMFDFPILRGVPESLRIEFVHAASVLISLATIFFLLYLHGLYAKRRQNTSLRYADNVFAMRQRQAAIPAPPQGGNANP